MSYTLQIPTSKQSLVSSLKESISMPFLEGAGGIVSGIILGDYVSGLLITSMNLTGNMALAVKGGVKFGFAGVALWLTSANRGFTRIVGLGIALGSVTSFFVDLLAALPWSKTLGLSYARTARQLPSVHQTTATPFRERPSGTGFSS